MRSSGRCKPAEVAIHIGPHSVLGADGLSSSRDMIPPPTADQAVISTLKRRLAGDGVVLFCMHCKNWKSRTKVERVPDPPQCPLCSARLVAALKPWEEEQIGIAKKKGKTA